MAVFRGYAVGSFDNADGFTYNYTVPAGNDRAVVFFVNIDGNESFSQLSYNGSTCSLIRRVKDSTSVFDIASEAWYLNLGSGAEITTATLYATSASGAMGVVSLFAVDVTGVAQDTTIGASSGTQNLGTAQSTAVTNITTLYNNSLLLVNCAGQGGDYDPWTSLGGLTDTFNGDTGTSTVTDQGIYLGYRAVITPSTYEVGAIGSVNDENVVLAVELKDVGGGSLASASLTSIRLLINSAIQLFKSSNTASPGLITNSLIVSSPSIQYSQSKTANHDLITSRLVIYSPTINISSIARPSLSIFSLRVNSHSSFSGGGINGNAAPDLLNVSLIVNSSNISFSRSSTASVSLTNLTLYLYQAISNIGGSSTATPNLTQLRFLLNSHVSSSSGGSQNSIATPGLVNISIGVFDVNFIADLVDIFLESKIEKNIFRNSEVEKFLKQESEMNKRLLFNSKFGSTEE